MDSNGQHNKRLGARWVPVSQLDSGGHTTEGYLPFVRGRVSSDGSVVARYQITASSGISEQQLGVFYRGWMGRIL